MLRHSQQFNIILVGVGGQGLLTLLKTIAKAALLQGCNFRSSELHGLSQRGGSMQVHIRLGPESFSPLIMPGEADLVLALESQEALAGIPFASKKTRFVINDIQTPTLGQTASKLEVKKSLKKITPNIEFIKATQICQEKLKSPVVAGVFLLGYACVKGFLPIRPQFIKKSLQELIPPKYLDLNIKAFNIGLKLNVSPEKS